MDISLDQIETRLAKFIYEIETEDRLVRVGLKEKAQTEKIYAKYKELFSQKTLEFLAGQIKKSKDKKDQDILERLYFAIASSFVGLALAKKSDRITTYFSQATVKVNGEKIAYFQINPRIAKENVFEKREKYEKAAVPVVKKINPLELSSMKEEIGLLKQLGFVGYVDYFSRGKKMDYAKFYKVVAKIGKETDSIWGKTINKVSVDVFKRPFKKINACHLIYLRSMAMFDSYYPSEKVVGTFEKFVRGLGLAELLTRIQIDDRDRPRKNPRAVCYWPNPPKEVHLVIKPIGGEQDFEAMFHEGGHALHASSQNPGLPFAHKMLSRSNALTETYAFVLEDLVFEPSWLARFLNISSHTGNKIKWQAHFVNLMMLRRYLGKFKYEYEMFSHSKIAKGPKLYAKTLGDMTGFVTNPNNWLIDMDGGFYSADYLRAWIAAAQIKDYLKKRFGLSWFLTEKAGKFLRRLGESGVTYEVEGVVKKLGYKPWDVTLLVKAYRETLE